MYVRHKVKTTCLGAGWKHMDIAYCGCDITTYQYRPTRAKGDLTPLNLTYYTRCAYCTAKLWHQRRLERYARSCIRG